jgi:hypothetical protein
MNKNNFLSFLLLFFPALLIAQSAGLPKVREVNGGVSRFDEKTDSFIPVQVGEILAVPTLFLTDDGAELVVSFPGKIAARMAGNSQAVFAPAQDGRYEVDLRKGTLSALLDPKRDKMNDPAFSIRTLTGVTEATGTFYAVTEYKGQTYSAVKKGKVKKKVIPPPKPNFAAYLKKATSSMTKPKLKK